MLHIQYRNNTVTQMGFLGKVVKTGHNFLGKINRASNFLGKALPHVSTGLRYASQVTSNPAVQAAARDFGVSGKALQTASNIGAKLGQAAAVADRIPGAVAGTKRSLSTLYQQAHG